MAKSMPNSPIKLPCNACLGDASERMDMINKIDESMEIYEIICASFV
jgi:hypothetical protein